MDGATITLIIGIIGCIIGVSTFVSALQNKAQNNGVLEQKIEQALQGIDEIKKQVRDSTTSQSNLSLTVNSHTEQIKNLYDAIEELKNRLNTIDSIANTLSCILDTIKSIKSEPS